MSNLTHAMYLNQNDYPFSCLPVLQEASPLARVTCSLERLVAPLCFARSYGFSGGDDNLAIRTSGSAAL